MMPFLTSKKIVPISKKIAILIFFISSHTAVGQSIKKLEQDFKRYKELTYITDSADKFIYPYKMLEIAIKLDNPIYIGDSYLELCYRYESFGNHVMAIDFAQKAVKIYEKAKQYAGISATYAALSNIYSAIYNYPMSIEYLHKAMALNKYRNERAIIYTYINLGDSYRLSGQLDTALYYNHLGYKKCCQLNDSLGMGYALCNIGLIYYEQNLFNKSDSVLTEAFKILNLLGDKRAIIVTNYEIAKKDYETGYLERPKKMAEKALKEAKALSLNTETRDIYLLLSKITQDLCDYKNAFKYMSAYNVLDDSLKNSKVMSQIAEKRAKFEISLNEAEMTYLKKISRTRANMLVISVVSLILIIVLLIFLYRQSKQRKFANNKLSEFNEELKQKNEIINNQLTEKEMLMKEIHHRVKNNLQIISSIINLQSMQINDKHTIEIFNEMQRRIMAISSIHQKLYQSDSVSSINMKDYLGEVVEATHQAFNNKNLNVNYEISIQNIHLNIDIAVSLGLILNELTTNAYKYAFKKQRENSLFVGLNHNNQNTFTLIVQDNGPGIPDDIDIFNSNSLGLRMVSLLTRQMHGKIQAENKDGTRISLIFNNTETKS